MTHTYEDVILAIKFATLAHGDQLYGDKPYTYHLQGVAKLVNARNEGEDNLNTLLIIAWLHDVREDTDVDIISICEAFGMTVANAVIDLTHYEGMSREVYLQQCKANPLAREVKICDTMFNLQQSFKSRRGKGMKKYPAQLAYLTAEGE